MSEVFRCQFCGGIQHQTVAAAVACGMNHWSHPIAVANERHAEKQAVIAELEKGGPIG